VLKNFKKPVLRGEDVGDHPPITPSRIASQKDLSGDYWKLYELVCLNFFASLAEPAEYEEKVFQLEINGEIFEEESKVITKEGYLAFMEWKRKNYVRDFPILKLDSILIVQNISYESNWTDPPSHLSESDLLKLMEHNKIGTDASMPVHIENITQRGYVKVDANRRLTPTKLGKALIESISAVEPDLVQPTIRSQIETYVDQVAKGTKKSQDALSYAVELYKKKFLIVRQNYEKILSGFKKYFDIDLMEMNKVYQTIKSKNEALRIQNTVKKR
jgi:DNA topoisomerase-3